MSSENDLQFPDRLIVRLIEEDTGDPVPSVVITLTLYAKKKNNYNFGPSLSDLSGTITIERDWVQKSINETRAFFLMDYASTVDNCHPYVDLSVMSVDDIQRAIAASELYGTVPEKLGVAPSIPELRRASNHNYVPQTVRVTLDIFGEKVREIVIKLRRRAHKLHA